MSNLTSIYGGNQTLINDPNLCTLQTCDLTLASLTYVPNLAGNALYLAFFALFLIAQTFLGIRYKTWGFCFAIFLGLALEVLGYVGRVLMALDPFINNDFLIYLICVTIAPALLTAAIYLCLARIVTVYGAEISRFRPRTYTIVFCGCDLFSLVLQGLGGGIAATAISNSSKTLGKNIMVAGLAFQVFSLILFTICCGEFALRLRQNRGCWNPKFLTLVNSRLFKCFLWGLAISVLTVFIRSVFRCVELSGGFNSTLFNEQIPFMILEGPMVIIACTVLTVFHPGIAFQGAWKEADFTFRPFFKSHKNLNVVSEKIDPVLSDEESVMQPSHGEAVELSDREQSD